MEISHSKEKGGYKYDQFFCMSSYFNRRVFRLW